MSAGDAAVGWLFLTQILRDLEEVGQRYGLGRPPLRTAPPPDLPVDDPGDQVLAGNAGLDAELAALEDDEILVAVPVELPGEDPTATLVRLHRTEEAVSGRLGPSRASSTAGEVYVWAFPLPGSEDPR